MRIALNFVCVFGALDTQRPPCMPYLTRTHTYIQYFTVHPITLSNTHALSLSLSYFERWYIFFMRLFLQRWGIYSTVKILFGNGKMNIHSNYNVLKINEFDFVSTRIHVRDPHFVQYYIFMNNVQHSFTIWFWGRFFSSFNSIFKYMENQLESPQTAIWWSEN